MKAINQNSNLKHVFYPDTFNLSDGPILSYPHRYYTKEVAIEILEYTLKNEGITRKYVYIGLFNDSRDVSEEDIKRVKRETKLKDLC